MEVLTEDWRLGAARCLEAEAQTRDFDTFLKLTLIATRYRLEVAQGEIRQEARDPMRPLPFPDGFRRRPGERDEP